MPEMTIQQAFDLAVQHHQAGRLNEAESIYRQILAAEPQHFGSLHHLGLIAHQVGKNEIAVDMIRQALVLNPTSPEAYSNLGNALREIGQHDEAISACRKAIAIQPGFPGAHYNLGLALYEKKQLDGAIAAYRQVIALRPSSPEAYSKLGNALQDKGRLDEAIVACRHALVLHTGYPEAHNNLANALRAKGELPEALAALRQAIALQPDNPAGHCNLGITLAEMGQFDEAIAAYRQAITIQPLMSVAHNNLGGVLKEMGRLDEAIVAYQQALSIRADYSSAHSNLVLTMHYPPGLEASVIAEEHRRWNRLHAEPLRPFIQPHANERSPDRRLRIGYVSPDFRDHSVAYFLEGLLEHHDPAQVEVFCYADVANPDAVTARMEQFAGHWHRIIGLADAELADLIRADGIDILVDLAGHTANNRLPVFARKPAPVQVSWLGYPNTTGLDTIDYRLTDALADPLGSGEELYTEQLVRLPRSGWCYRPFGQSPPVGVPPVHDTGYITFGCFNAMAKINDPLLELSTKILLAVPGSRLLLKNSPVAEPSVRQRISAMLGQAGIGPERLQVLGRVPDIAGHLACYGRVDIALDTFPYHGTTTTCEALWMGVPVVTLAGQTHVSRVGVSLLSNLGLAELIATSPGEYVDLAVGLAADLPRLAGLRASLRERMRASPLMDAAAFASDMEAAYREMWRKWCEQSESTPWPK
jgi:predicted O-linked N-acetylglucosamine transferase (SPINDLY family)